MPIKVILESLYSKRDRNGNCYWAFRYTDTATGKQVVGNISGGESNIRSMLRPLGLDSETVHSTITEIPIREFNRLTKPGLMPDARRKSLRSTSETSSATRHDGQSIR